MPTHFSFKASFQKAYDRLPREKQLLVLKALEAVKQSFQTGRASYGLHIKKLYAGSLHKTFEARVSLDLRPVWIQTKEEAVFCLLGSHEEVQRFLKTL